MLKHIRADQVTLGMYVRKFEGSWFYHPFWRARFVVRSDRMLARVRKGGVNMVIDTAKGADLTPEPAVEAGPSLLARKAAPFVSQRQSPMPSYAPSPPRAPARVQAPQAFGKADKARAAALAQRSTKVVKALFENCELGRSVSTDSILSVVDDIASTLELNSGAFISVTRLKTKDDAIYTHSVAVCALMIGLAREAGAVPAVVQAMGTAGLLHDVGKLAIGEAALKKADQRDAAEEAEFRRHPELGHGMLMAEAGLPPVTLDVCLHHHERLDGSGYPFGMRGESISRAARIAAICDVYDSMTSSAGGEKGVPPAEAIARMEASGDELDVSLLFKFMRSIGVFPAGKLVRLRSNRLAIILPAAGEDRRPVARSFYATIDTRFTLFQDVVLSDRLCDDQAVSEEDPGRWFQDDWPAMCARIMTGKALTAAPLAI